MGPGPGLGGGKELMAGPNDVPTYVPQQYRAWVAEASAKTGIPASVVAAQINRESGFQPGVSSSAGAVGIAQFLPSTYRSVGGTGPMTNAQNELQPYITYMNQLLKAKNGNLAAALAAYNAGPAARGAGLAQGQQYANAILRAAGSPGGTINPATSSGTSTGTAAPAGASDAATNGAIGALSAESVAGILGQAGFADQQAIYSDKCLISTPQVFGIGGACLLSKAEGRQLLGGLLIFVGGATATVGFLILAAYGLKATGANRAIGNSLQAVGGAVSLVAPEVGVPIATVGHRKKTKATAQRTEKQASKAAGKGKSFKDPGPAKSDTFVDEPGDRSQDYLHDAARNGPEAGRARREIDAAADKSARQS